MPTPRKFLCGEKIGVWDVIEFVEHRSNGHYYWKVQCINCKAEWIKETSHINKQYGCRNCRQFSQGQTGLKNLFTTYNGHARRKSREFNLTIDEFQALTSGNCYFCNAKPSQVIANNARNPNKISHWGDYTYNGIDRLDNTIGYIKSNCISCCGICNWAKSNRSVDEFKSYIRNICKNAVEGTIPFLQNTDSLLIRGQ